MGGHAKTLCLAHSYYQYVGHTLGEHDVANTASAIIAIKNPMITVHVERFASCVMIMALLCQTQG